MKTEPMRCCEDLTCKTMYYRDDERPGMIHDSDVLTYTCFKTMSPVGPDGQAARPPLCQPNRPCYVGDAD